MRNHFDTAPDKCKPVILHNQTCKQCRSTCDSVKNPRMFQRLRVPLAYLASDTEKKMLSVVNNFAELGLKLHPVR